MINRKGFTLLELMIVVIVIGILASMAIPQYLKTVERGRQSEAFHNLGLLRGAEMRYLVETGGYTATISNLDVDDPNDLTGAYFDYAVDAETGTATATRNEVNRPAGVTAYTVTLTVDGTLTKGF